MLLSLRWVDGVIKDASGGEKSLSNLGITNYSSSGKLNNLFPVLSEVSVITAEVRTLLEQDDRWSPKSYVDYNDLLNGKTITKASVKSNALAGASCPYVSTNCDEIKNINDLAELSNCVYLRDDRPCESHYRAASLTNLNVQLSDLVRGSFRAEIYYHRETGKHVVAFAGTDFDSLSDWANNYTQEIGFSSLQYRKAVALAEQLVRDNPGVDFTFTGHSLGGGLATAAAAAVGGEAIVFNPAALDSRSAQFLGVNYNYAMNNTTTYSVAGELLYSLQTGIDMANQLEGMVNILPRPNFTWVQSNVQTDPIETYRIRLMLALHGIDAVSASLADLLEQQNCLP